jgi:hypothetical protein
MAIVYGGYYEILILRSLYFEHYMQYPNLYKRALQFARVASLKLDELTMFVSGVCALSGV